ncbi:AraC family transcriptional regulator [Parahaliea maris]|uniref:AraC family transcriptional regulator n=1 Tax=Parahaliea maris TaxID=2716870 RepID=A0A5C9A6Y0_9GAMM|nr:AraC family transcriptional regulator [Parahaliea maris]TXS95839.1 AraC family transcriptional regulator [Parahaliea maris]
MTKIPELPAQHSSLLARYGQAMVLQALAAGFDMEIIVKALSIPPRLLESLDEIPISNQMLDDFMRQVEREGHREYQVDLSPSAEISPELFGRLQRNIKWLLRDEFLGLTQTPCKAGVFLVMIELVMSTSTLASALQKGFRFYRALTDEVWFSLSSDANYAELTVHLASPAGGAMTFWSEWWLLTWHRMSCWLIGDSIPILSARFPHEPGAPMQEYARIFSNDCQFGRATATIRFHRHFLDKRLVRTEEELTELVADRNLNIQFIPGLDNPLALRIEVQLEHQFKLVREFLTMEQVAESYHMSSQTLRRRLDDEGSSFRLIKERIRRRAVMQWLNDPEIPISEIAHMTGFAESNGLSRAVKSWTGLSPTEYREKLSAASGD